MTSGIQYPPFHFPPGDALQTFLGCLQGAISPTGLMMMMMMMMIYIIIITPADLVQWISHILDFTDFMFYKGKKSPFHVSFAWKCFPQAQSTPLWILLWKMETRDWSKVLFTDRTELQIRIFFILSKAKGQSCVSAKTEWWGGEETFWQNPDVLKIVQVWEW